MKPFAAAAALAAAALAACVATPPAPEPSYFVMRHLQKAEGEDAGLTDEGRRCAAQLAEDLADSGISAVYVSTTRRARETAAPLASRLDLQPSEYDPRNTPRLIERVRAESGSVLVVGHSNTVPEIVERLGGVRPGDIPDARYGDVWQVARAGGATAARRVTGC